MWREGVEEKRQKDQKLPGETEMWRTKAGRAGKRPGRPSGSLIHSCRSGPGRRGKAGLMRLQGLVSVGDDLDSAARGESQLPLESLPGVERARQGFSRPGSLPFFHSRCRGSYSSPSPSHPLALDLGEAAAF